MANAKFTPKLGQIDYTNARWAPVVNCVLKFRDKILVVQRSKSLNFYPEYWNGISGFLDDNRSLEQKVKDEIREELGIGEEHIISICKGEIFDQEEPKYNKTWIVHSVLVEVDTDKITLDWEARNYQWINLENAAGLKLLPGFNKVLQNLFENSGGIVQWQNSGLQNH